MKDLVAQENMLLWNVKGSFVQKLCATEVSYFGSNSYKFWTKKFDI